MTRRASAPTRGGGPAAALAEGLDEHGLARLLDRLEEGILAIDEKLEIRFANPAAERLLGAGAGTQLPDPWPEPSLRELVAGLYVPDVPELNRIVRVDDDLALRLHGLPGGPSTPAILVLTDVSDRERRERAEREFVANAAHELRTPLTAITSAIEVLQAGAKHFEAERDLFLGHIEREAGRLRRLAHSLLLLARAQALQEQPRVELVELRPLLDDAAAAAAVHSSVRIGVDCPRDLGALANREMVEQIVAVLVSNAARYTSEGEVELRGRREGKETVIEVADTGSGISEHVIERLGDRFLRGSEGSFGLGLSIARQLAHALRARLELSRRDGGGTLAALRLPVARMTRR